MAPPPGPDVAPPRPPEPAWREFARAPLVPVALAATAGLCADRYAGLPQAIGLAAAAVGVIGWAGAVRRRPGAGLPLLWLAAAGLAAADHHTHRNSFPADDIGEWAGADPHLVKLRGVILDEPTPHPPPRDPFAPPRAKGSSTTTLRVTAVAAETGGWVPASGDARLTVEAEAVGVRAGDAVELVGMLSRPRPPANPGESDYAGYLLDQRIRAEVRVGDSAAGVVRLDPGADPWAAGLAAVRGRAARTLADHLAPADAAVARALLLGDTAAMDRAEWDAYVRTGVVHALAISGQHLVVLAGFAWVVCRAAGVRQGRGAWAVMILVGGYAVLTGGRPSGVRAAAMVAAVCGGLILRRPVIPANAFALGWLVVLLLNPADPFTLGCQLSFLSVFVLVWGVGRWLTPRPRTPLEQLIDESRPGWERAARSVGRTVFAAYAISIGLGLANAPLVAAGVNLVSPVGLTLGPPLVFLTAVALIAGFVLLLVGPLGGVATPFALVTGRSLAWAGELVHAADALPGGAVYLPSPPLWWLVGFYAILGIQILLDPVGRKRLAAGLLGWVFVGLLLPAGGGPAAGELRVTFLAVGHGGCTVLETPDGRCLVYDTGTTAGPSAVRRVVAPYLWHRGVRRVDELFLSHADTDHFNGVAELFKRFPVGRVTLTPSFRHKPTSEVAEALLVFDRAGVERRVAGAGDRFVAGAVTLDVLHPPPDGPAGTENERSLVLAVRYAGQTLLLTGDLDKAGTARVLGLPAEPAAVLMAPHHGSRAALPAGLVRWAAPRLVVAPRGPERGNTVRPGDAGPAAVWDTWTAGAVTVRVHATGVVAEAFRTGDRQVVARAAGR